VVESLEREAVLIAADRRVTNDPLANVLSSGYSASMARLFYMATVAFPHSSRQADGDTEPMGAYGMMTEKSKDYTDLEFKSRIED